MPKQEYRNNKQQIYKISKNEINKSKVYRRRVSEEEQKHPRLTA